LEPLLRGTETLGAIAPWDGDPWSHCSVGRRPLEPLLRGMETLLVPRSGRRGLQSRSPAGRAGRAPWRKARRPWRPACRPARDTAPCVAAPPHAPRGSLQAERGVSDRLRDRRPFFPPFAPTECLSFLSARGPTDRQTRKKFPLQWLQRQRGGARLWRGCRAPPPRPPPPAPAPPARICSAGALVQD